MPVSSKTVRFSNKNKTYSFSSDDSPPPLVMSVGSSSSSSSGPRTPPSPFGGPMSGYKELPVMKNEVKIHPTLSAVVGVRYNFDVSTDPAITLFDSTVLHASVLGEPATSPPLREVYVVSRYLPWKLPILPSRYSFVTVADVLGGMYCALRIPVQLAEYECQRKETKAALNEAFNRRVRKLARIDSIAAERERQKGMKRIDFMVGNHYFAGFTKEGARPNELIMHTGK